MKVYVAAISAECNEHVSKIAKLEDIHLMYGDECIDSMSIRDVFEPAGIEIIPGLSATVGTTGMIDRNAYEYMADYIINTAREHLFEIDAIYLQLHGASGVVDLDEVSGEHYLMKRLRALVGQFMPIALVEDPHGNMTKELGEATNIVRCYRESPHSDLVECGKIVAGKLVDLMKNRRPMKPIILKLPMLVGGEQSMSAYEPMKSINAMLDKAEEDPRVFSSCFFVGYLSHDDDKLGSAVAIVPNTPADYDYCLAKGKEIAQYVWDNRHEFHFRGIFDAPEDAIVNTLRDGKKTSVITDSGDNCGAGAMGQNTGLLKLMLKHYQDTETPKKVLFAGIRDVKAHAAINDCKVGDHVSFDLGANEDELSAPVHIEGTIIQHGDEYYGYGNSFFMGRQVGEINTVRIDGTLIDVMVLDVNVQYGHMYEFERAGLNFHDYDIVVVKMGYLDTFLIPETAYHNMAVTDGATVQEPQKFDFKRIYRPIWPLDDVKELTFIDR